MYQYAYVQDGIVLDVEKRTQDPRVKLESLYHPDFVPFFIEIPYAQWDYVTKGWSYSEEKGFQSPEQEFIDAMQEVIEE